MANSRISGLLPSLPPFGFSSLSSESDRQITSSTERNKITKFQYFLNGSTFTCTIHKKHTPFFHKYIKTFYNDKLHAKKANCETRIGYLSPHNKCVNIFQLVYSNVKRCP